MLQACSIGVMAYNEEANIAELLGTLSAQQTTSVNITEIVVVASGCTDKTPHIVEEWAGRDSRIRLLVQPSRQGKASAINYFLQQAREQIVVLCSADLLPTEIAIEHLVAPFADIEIGMTTARPVPVNDKDTFMGFAAHMMWELHHQRAPRCTQYSWLQRQYNEWLESPSSRGSEPRIAAQAILLDLGCGSARSIRTLARQAGLQDAAKRWHLGSCQNHERAEGESFLIGPYEFNGECSGSSPALQTVPKV